MKVAVTGPAGAGAASFTAAAADLQRLSLPGWEATRRTIDGCRVYLDAITGPPWWLLWPQLLADADAVILVAPAGQRLPQARSYLDALAGHRLAVAVNRFAAPRCALADMRAGLRLDPMVPIAACDARDPAQAAAALEHLIRQLFAQDPALPGAAPLTWKGTP